MFKQKTKRILPLKLFLSLGVFFSFAFISQAQAATPVLYFSDLTDGPISGWNQSPTKGAAVSIWGRNFGTERGTSYVTVGGVNLTSDSDYAEWGATTNPTTASGQERITFWLNSNMSLGDSTITVTTPEGTSQAIPFYTRNTGNIYFVDRSGDDNNTGINDSDQTFRHPWKAKQIVQPGDTIYIRNGQYTEYEYEGSHSTILMFSSGLSQHTNGVFNNSIILASYPGELATFGDKTTESFFWQYNCHVDYWTFSKLRIDTYNHPFKWESSNGLNFNESFRIVGNDLTSEIDTATKGHLINIFSNATHMQIFGNYLHDTGKDNSGDFIYKTLAIYFSGGGISDYVEFAWNHIFECAKPVQFFGHWVEDRLDNLLIHDNWFDTSMEGDGAFVVGGGDPQNIDSGEIYTFVQNAKIYNNVFKSIKGDFRIDSGHNGIGGNFEVYNNTFYNSGGSSSSTLHIVSPALFKFYNNILYLTEDNTNYYSNSNSGYPNSPTNVEDGRNNLWYGKGDGPSWSVNDIQNQNPEFVDIFNSNFYLQFTSPARNAGTTVSLVTRDFDGVSRPQGSAYDIGAYEYVADSTIRADVDQSSIINSTDAMLTLRKSLGLDMSLTNWQNSTTTGDVNCDGTTNSTDAMLVLRHSLGLDMSGIGWCE